MFRKTILAVCCLALYTPSISSGDTIVYGDLEGPGMFFTGVTETSVFDALPLYGAPSINGNKLSFTSPTFSAIAAAGSLDFVDGRMTANVTAKGDTKLSGITLEELGFIDNSGPDMEVFVSAIAFAVADGKIYQSTFTTSSEAPLKDKWENSLSIEFDAPVSSFSFVADNQLFARAGFSSSSSINKDNIQLTVHVVPEPTAAVGIGLASLALMRRRR